MNKNEIRIEGRAAGEERGSGMGANALMRGEGAWCESTGEFTLPDYMPKIGKMLSCTPRIIPSGRYIGSDRAEFSGSVLYSVLYTGEDGSPCHTTLSGDYEYTVPLGDAIDSPRVEIYDEPMIENVSLRASGPRKMSVRTRIRSTPYIMYESTREAERADLAGDDLEKLTRRIPVSCQTHIESGEFTLSESFKLDASPESEVVGCDGAVFVTEAAPSSGIVTCRGEVECRVLYYDIEGGRRRLFCTKKKMRFEERIPYAAAGELSGLRMYGRLISTDLAASEDSSEFSISAVVALYGDFSGTEERAFLLDAYSCEHPEEVMYETEEYRRCVLCRNANYSFHTQKNLPESLSTDTEVCTAVASARVGEVSVSDGVVEVNGEITVECVLCHRGEDGAEYSVMSMPIPVRCEFPAEYSAERYETGVMCETGDARVRIDGDSLSADAELYLALTVNGIESVNVVKSTHPSDECIQRRDGITVYYPDREETLWSVSKKFAVPVSAVASKNAIKSTSPDSPESLDGISSLIIA